MELFLAFIPTLLVVFIVLTGVYIYILYVKKQLETENKFTEKYSQLQKIYYERMLAEDESVRRFRRDITKHINKMNELCVEDRVEELKSYIKKLGGQYEEDTVRICTGNLVADYLIHHVVKKLEDIGGTKYEVIGKFPPETKISNSDLSVLLGNALENAEEALREMESGRSLEIVIKNFQNHIFLSIANSIPDKKEIDLQTTKSDLVNHGYGIKNMTEVVAKYSGDIKFCQEDNKFIVEIEI